MKPTLLVTVLALGALAIVLLWVLEPGGNERDLHLSPASARARESAALVAARGDAGGDGGRKKVDSPDRRESERAERSRKAGALEVMSEREFLDRLRELGVEDPRSLFDRIHDQRADKGAVLVLVSDEDDNAVSNATVLLDPAAAETLHAQVGSGSYSSEVRRATTGGSGVALFANVEPIAHLLAVEHRDYLTEYFGSVEARAGERTYVEAVLEKARARIEGVVTNTSALPLNGVLVHATHYTEGGVDFGTSAVTGYDGTFSLGVLEGSQNAITATKLGYQDARLEHVPAETRNLRITLHDTETVTVEGFVTRGSSLDPVTVFSVDSDRVHDPQGRFRVERNVESGPQALVFAAEGFEPSVRSVDTSAGKDVDLGQVPLYGHKELNGIVLLRQAEEPPRPLEGATVSIVASSGAASFQVTAADGLFSFRELVEESVRLSASAPGASRFEDSLVLDKDEPTYVEIILSQGEHSVRGLVVDGDSEEPIEGARVEVVEQAGHAALSDENGAYEIHGIPLAEFTLEASKSGYRSETSPTIVGSDEGATWDARLEPSGLRIRFQLAGQPAPPSIGVTLWTRIEPGLSSALAAQQELDSLRFQAATDEDGEVTFDVEAGDYFVHVPVYRLHPTRVHVDSESSDWITIPLPGVTSLDGRILSADGSPVANTSLWLHSGDQDYSTMFLYHTDGAGNYSIPSLAPRPYALSIVKSVADQSAQHVRELSGSGAPSQTYDVIFPPLTASVSGRLTDENGIGKAEVRIGVEYLDAPHRSILAGWVGTDAAGHFHVPRLEPGRHILRTAWTEDEAVFSEEILLEAGEHRSVDLVAPRVAGKHVRGHMIASDGGPLGGSFVFATDSQGHQNGNYFSSMEWGYVGPFDVAGLRSDAYRLDLTAMGCEKRTIQVQVAGPVTGLLVTMERED